MNSPDTSRPVLLLGGGASTLAAARSLGSAGIPVYVSGRAGCRAMRSRHCRLALQVPVGMEAPQFWQNILISTPDPKLSGCVIMVGCDESLEFVETHEAALREHYVVEEFLPDLRRAMLDKLDTLTLARQAGVPTPNFWAVDTAEDVQAIRDELRFPVMVKPLNSLTFMEEFGRKLFIVREDFAEVVEKVRLCRERGHKVMVVEMIPGPDNLLTSYYTYRTTSGVLLYNYTKSVIRRWPVNRGGACFHQSEWLPETAEMGRRMFNGIGWQGIGNVEFKRDTRDGQLKIIEVNGRLTAGHPLVTRGGAPLDVIIYCHLTGQALPRFDSYSQTLRLWDPMRDFMAFLQLRRAGELGFRGWIRSIFAQKIILPFFCFDDPRPGLAEFSSLLGKLVRAPLAIGQRAGQNAD
jgi:D-aspartate ligase